MRGKVEITILAQVAIEDGLAVCLEINRPEARVPRRESEQPGRFLSGKRQPRNYQSAHCAICLAIGFFSEVFNAPGIVEGDGLRLCLVVGLGRRCSEAYIAAIKDGVGDYG